MASHIFRLVAIIGIDGPLALTAERTCPAGTGVPTCRETIPNLDTQAVAQIAAFFEVDVVKNDTMIGVNCDYNTGACPRSQPACCLGPEELAGNIVFNCELYRPED
ncbi:hypothetical protein VTL71DRAFT_14002 [Oculimacula yallundae]|uniref:Hydrophobin n=1 Tax=Oculimacula yallundae TaxID=86028 RepID=A0ABR4CLX2_9HELO